MLMKKIFFVFLLLISTKVFADSQKELGLEIFNNKAQCGMCHALKDAKAEGQKQQPQRIRMAPTKI